MNGLSANLRFSVSIRSLVSLLFLFVLGACADNGLTDPSRAATGPRFNQGSLATDQTGCWGYIATNGKIITECVSGVCYSYGNCTVYCDQLDSGCDFLNGDPVQPIAPAETCTWGSCDTPPWECYYSGNCSSTTNLVSTSGEPECPNSISYCRVKLSQTDINKISNARRFLRALDSLTEPNRSMCGYIAGKLDDAITAGTLHKGRWDADPLTDHAGNSTTGVSGHIDPAYLESATYSTDNERRLLYIALHEALHIAGERHDGQSGPTYVGGYFGLSSPQPDFTSTCIYKPS